MDCIAPVTGAVLTCYTIDVTVPLCVRVLLHKDDLSSIALELLALIDLVYNYTHEDGNEYHPQDQLDCLVHTSISFRVCFNWHIKEGSTSLSQYSLLCLWCCGLKLVSLHHCTKLSKVWVHDVQHGARVLHQLCLALLPVTIGHVDCSPVQPVAPLIDLDDIREVFPLLICLRVNEGELSMPTEHLHLDDVPTLVGVCCSHVPSFRCWMAMCALGVYPRGLVKDNEQT